MAIVYSKFDSTPATIVADIKAKILLNSSDWSNPTGQILQATAANGAKMVIDLIGLGAADNQRLRPRFFRDYTAGAGVDGLQRDLYWMRNAGASTYVLHCKVVASNTMLWIQIEGPRAGETGADNVSYGSYQQNIWLTQLVPYFPTLDTTPCIIAGGSSSAPGYESIASSYPGSNTIHQSRNISNTTSWVGGRLFSLGVPVYGSVIPTAPGWVPFTVDGNAQLFPYVVMDDTLGERGRLSDIIFAGWAGATDYLAQPYSAGQQVTYSGNTFEIVDTYKTDVTGNAANGGSLASMSNGGTTGKLLVGLKVA